ncbi:SSS family solute:Na+ symporter [Marinoscillum furvescens DSM 4134]|uniref:SSS family solute:Na+ symporter n=1 Tax=Marinoscillum furvescens DSM 4134 TaxID=1122208 RepID=A0A3D9L114_MARFU|nr:SSS family solute:Na+ symporter [Marinoscillum furvescens DSM 4134]
MNIHWIDLLVFVIYMIAMLGVGFFFLNKNKSTDDYYVGGRSMSSWHVGLSVVATDVGGGFSIGLGGLGFTMGLSGSWMLFTGLLGAWLAAVILIPRLSELPQFKQLFTFPQIFSIFYDKKTALLAGIISAIGYAGFTSSQLLAGAKLASSTFTGLNLQNALIIMGVIAVVYTVMGGLKAVIYTDTIQWALLLSGLVFIGLPLGYIEVGGYSEIKRILPNEFLSLGNITWQDLVNWGVTIIPIWFVGMTLYQRIYACKSKKEAQKAWYIAGAFEWPVMAFMGVLLGMFARVGAEAGMFAYMGYESAEGMDAETGLPMLLRTILPAGLMGLMMSAYFSAVLSTADSCLMASSGNLVTDIIGYKNPDQKKFLRLSQLMTLVIGALALLLASVMQSVLELMLYSYAFMVSGLFVPVLGGLFTRKPNPNAAFWSMLLGGGTTISLILLVEELPLGLDANIFGISISLITFLILNQVKSK